MPDALHPMFRGYNNNKEKFLTRVLDVAQLHPSYAGDLAALQLASRSAFDEAALECDELVVAREPCLAEMDGAELLSIKIVGSSDVSLATVIEILQNSDWVLQGRKYFDPESGICPFCQQQTKLGFADELNEYFDSRYAQQSALVTALVDNYAAATSQVIESLTKIEETAPVYLDLTAFKGASSRLKSALRRNNGLLDSKLRSPGSVVELESLSDLVRAVGEVIGLANVRIREHNERVRNHGKARAKLTNDCWSYFVHTILAADIARYQGKHSGLQSAVDNLRRRIKGNEELLRSSEARLRDLERQTVSSAPIIDEINKLLESVGFGAFKLVSVQDLKGGYYLVRPDGTRVTEFLSEGERTFVTFLYYFHQLQGLDMDSSEPRGRVAVIDDPISSLDSDVLFVVSSLVRRLASDIRRGSGRVQQLIVLTHNVYFHKEVTFKQSRTVAGDETFHLVHKGFKKPSTIEVCDRNPVQTSYARLWGEVVHAEGGDRMSRVSLQNTLRRILQIYFRVLGGVPDDDIVGKFNGLEQSVCRSLFSWMNDGSHSALDEIDYSPSEIGTEIYLKVFRQIFDRMGHGPHYEMMMRSS